MVKRTVRKGLMQEMSLGDVLHIQDADELVNFKNLNEST